MKNSTKVAALVIVVCVVACLAWYFLPDPEPPHPSEMIPASVPFYGELRDADTVIEFFSDVAERLKEATDNIEGWGESSGSYGEILSVLKRVLARPALARGSVVCLAVDTSKFTYLPDFAIVANVSDGRGMRRGTSAAMEDIGREYVVKSKRSGDWQLSVVAIGDAMQMYIGRRGRTLVVANSPAMYDEVTSSEEEDSLSCSPDFQWARGKVDDAHPLFVFSRPGDMGEGIPIDTLMSYSKDPNVAIIAESVKEMMGKKSLMATGVSLGEEAVIETFTRELEPSGRISPSDVPSAAPKIEQYLFPGVCFALSTRINLALLIDQWAGQDGSKVGNIGEDFELMRQLVAIGLFKDMIENLGPEVMLVVVEEEMTVGGLVMLEAKEGDKVQSLLSESLDGALKGGKKGSYALVGDVLAVAIEPASVDDAKDAFESGGGQMTGNARYERAVDGLPEVCNMWVFADVHILAALAEWHVVQMIDRNPELDSARKEQFKSLTAGVLNVFRIVESYGSARVTDGDETYRVTRLIISGS